MNRARRERYNSIEKQTKRKRELLGEDLVDKKGEEVIFRKNKMMLRSAQREEGKEKMIGMLKKMTDEMKEGLRRIGQEINKVAKE